MKDITVQYFEELMAGGETAKQVAGRLEAVLKFVFDDKEISMHDKVAGDLDFEELVAAMILARDLLRELYV
jgi:hypothetical protein